MKSHINYAALLLYTLPEQGAWKRSEILSNQNGWSIFWKGQGTYGGMLRTCCQSILLLVARIQKFFWLSMVLSWNFSSSRRIDLLRLISFIHDITVLVKELDCTLLDIGTSSLLWIRLRSYIVLRLRWWMRLRSFTKGFQIYMIVCVSITINQVFDRIFVTLIWSIMEKKFSF